MEFALNGQARSGDGVFLRLCHTLLAWMGLIALAGMADPARLYAQGARVPRAGSGRETLRDIQFIDPQRGWAVGDRGTLLRTVNGGEEWLECGTAMPMSSVQVEMDGRMQKIVERARSNAGTTGQPLQQTIQRKVDVRLNSVCFVDAERGWAVGGREMPEGSSAEGTILATSNGGLTWQLQSGSGAPLMHRLRMTNELNGTGFGGPGALQQGGEYQTRDAGRTWSSSMSGNQNHEFVDGDLAGKSWVAVSADGRLFRGRGDSAQPAILMHRQTRAIRRVRMLDEKRGFACGDGGSLLMTGDGGSSWVPMELEPGSQGILQDFDLRALHVSEEQLRVAGTPGTHVFTIAWKSGTVRAATTGTTATLQDLESLPDGNCWAAGSDGTILHSPDLGASWTVQRGGLSDLAILVVAFDDPEAGWELLARYADDERLACGVVRFRLDGSTGSGEGRFSAAAERLGVLQSDSYLATGEAGSAAPDWDWIRERLIRVIRQRRPQIVVCNTTRLQVPADGVSAAGVVDVHALLDQIIRDAAGLELPSHPALAGGVVPAWQVLRLATRDPVMNGDWVLEDGAWLTGLGCSVADHAMISRALAGAALGSPARQSYRITAYNAARTGSVSEGLFRDLGVDGGRKLQQVAFRDRAAANLADMNRAMQRSSELQRLAKSELRNANDRMALRMQISQGIHFADEELSGVWLVQLAEAALRQGREPVAAEALGYLVGSYPRHPLAPAAGVWLGRYLASAETRVLEDPKIQPWSPLTGSPIQRAGVTIDSAISDAVLAEADRLQIAARIPDTAEPPANDLEVPAAGLAQAAAALAEVDPGDASTLNREYWQNVSARLISLGAQLPGLVNHSQILLAQANAVRQSAGWQASESLFQKVLDRKSLDPLSAGIALREKRLAAGDRTDANLIARRTGQRPVLDGLLDDPVWATLPAGSMNTSVSPDGMPASAGQDLVWLAYDDEFLYLAGRFQRRQKTVRVADRSQPRPRDGLGAGEERVVFSWDLDRDGAWPLWLAIGSNGQLADGCGATRGWNPQWFVATSDDGAAIWTFEAAIAWRQFGYKGPPGDLLPLREAENPDRLQMTGMRGAADPASGWACGLEYHQSQQTGGGEELGGPGLSDQFLSLAVPRADASRFRLMEFHGGTGPDGQLPERKTADAPTR